VESPDDRIAERRAQLRAHEQQLDRESAARAAAGPGPQPQERRGGGTVRSVLVFTGILLLAAGLLGVAVTLNRFAGKDIGDAKLLGRAAVTSCTRHGPVTNKGFGYWQRCAATITWDDGKVSRLSVDAVFTSADIGTEVRVGDLGDYRTSKQLARADVERRGWLAWIGYAAGALAFIPGLILVLLARELLRFRRR